MTLMEKYVCRGNAESAFWGGEGCLDHNGYFRFLFPPLDKTLRSLMRNVGIVLYVELLEEGPVRPMSGHLRGGTTCPINTNGATCCRSDARAYTLS